MYSIRRIFYPELFQGKHKKKNYFEGWYFKLIDDSMEHALAVIPGIAIGRNSRDSHAFIQLLYNNEMAGYFRFDIKEFSYSGKKFAVRIADNYFSKDRISLNLSDEEFSISGKLSFNNIISLPKTLFMPGIMGPYSYVPFMECYHGIVNIHHNITGRLKISGDAADFTGGYGYIEKDWGRSFPKTWVWVQSNHFGTEDATVMFSAARIPWLGGSFPGFISFIRLGRYIHVFASYTKARLFKLDYNNGLLRVIVGDRHLRLELKVLCIEGGLLKAPKNGMMDRQIRESINARVHVKLTNSAGDVIFEGEGTNAGLEIM